MKLVIEEQVVRLDGTDLALEPSVVRLSLAERGTPGPPGPVGENVKGFIEHGSDPDVTRPADFGSVEWIGTVEPNNAVEGDTWIDTT